MLHWHQRSKAVRTVGGQEEVCVAGLRKVREGTETTEEWVEVRVGQDWGKPDLSLGRESWFSRHLVLELLYFSLVIKMKLLGLANG